MNKDKSTKLYMWLIVIVVAIGMIIAVVFLVKGSGGNSTIANNYNLWLDFTSINNPDADIIQRYSVKVNVPNMTSAGYDGDQINKKVNQIIESFRGFYETTYNNRIAELKVELKAAQMTDDEIDAYLKGIECAVGWDPSSFEIVAQRHFINREHYNRYYMIDPNDSGDVNLEKGFFYNRQVSKSHNVFYNDLLSPYTYFGDSIDGDVNKIFWGVSDVVLTQTFATVSDLRSNATSTDKESGWHFYQWNVKNFEDMIEIYTLTPVTGNWYLVGLIVVLFLAGIIYMSGVNRVGVSTKKGYIFKKKKKFIWINKDEL